MDAKEIEQLLNQSSPFIALHNTREEEYVFDNYTFLVNGKISSRYEIIEDNERFNIKFLDILVYPPQNYKVNLSVEKPVVLNYSEEYLNRKIERDKGVNAGYFILTPKEESLPREKD